LKKDSVNDSNVTDGLSNVTEGVPSLPPVESKVLAYQPKSKVTDRYAMRAPGSTRNNIKEGGSILEEQMDDDDDYFSEVCSIGDTRIESYVTEGLSMDNEDEYISNECSIGAKRIKSNVTDRIPHLPPVQLKGFQHLYKSTKTTSSGRVLASHMATIKHGIPRNDNARRRDRKKDKKIKDVKKVKPSPRNMMNMTNDPCSKPVFFSGTSQREVPNQDNNSIVKSAITDMRVVDTVDGARMDVGREENIFVLIPRRAAIKQLKNVNTTLLSMSALDKAKGFAEKRGNKRITATEGKNSNYVTVGLKPNRGSHGILDSFF
jgi:hypothetical protein